MPDVKNPEGLLLDPLLTRPDKVAIVALGLSAPTFLLEQMQRPSLVNPFDEVWSVNRGLRGIQHDKLFCMDDFRWLEKRDKLYTKYLREHKVPIITSTSYQDYPMSVPYPINQVMKTIEDDIFCVNTVSYMIAYAIHIGVKELSIYGADFSYPNGSTAESGGQAVAYLLGTARHFGMLHRIPDTSTLLYANTVKMTQEGVQRPHYGYHRIEEMADAKKKERDRKKAVKERTK